MTAPGFNSASGTDVDSYTGAPVPAAPTTVAAPGSADVPLVPQPDEPYVPTPPYERPLERNVRVGPLWCSSVRCPSCGTVYAHSGGLASDAPEPMCPRCTYVTLTPTPDGKAVMGELRRRYDRYVYVKGLNGASQKDQYDAFLQVHDAFWRHGPTLLEELERVFGQQGARAP